MAHSSPVSDESERDYAAPTGWVGWIVFAGIMMVLVGLFHAFQGLIALFQDSYYHVPKSGLTIHVSYTTWGWIHLILGVVIVLAGAGLLAGQMWARVVGVILAMLSTIVSIGFMSAYPIWSVMMVSIDILVIWALTVHGAEMESLNRAHDDYV